jgi:hypothetical protein
LQPWEGDITLVLPSHLWNLGKSIVNPTTTDILNATRQVRQAAASLACALLALACYVDDTPPAVSWRNGFQDSYPIL